ncbi:MAG: VPLPA-CTERM sorting domain-containing protein [Candidatus Thiodiazotropha sp.]
MKYLGTFCYITALSLGLAMNAQAASFHYETDLDLTDLRYQATINGVTGDLAANINRFDLGSGLDGPIDVQITSGNYNGFTTSLGFALTTDPNETLIANPDTFLQLTDPNADVTQFFNDNVDGWVLYSWGSDNIPSASTTNITEQLGQMFFDPNESYFAFIAGGSVVQDTVSVSLDISDGNNVNPVPLPAAVWFFGSGLIGLIGVSRRKRS